MRLLKELTSKLEELGELESSYFKARAYKNAALTLLNEFRTDEQFNNCEDYTYIAGIGSGINKKILEYKETGDIAKLQTLRAENAAYLDPRFYKVRQGFVTKKISYEAATCLVTDIWGLFEDPEESLGLSVVAGSYRRLKETIGDLDLLIPQNKYRNVIDTLSKSYEIISQGPFKTQFLIDTENNIPLDVIAYTEEDYIYQLLYLTGSRETNIRMRKAAQAKGLKLNQYGLWNENEDNVLPYPSNEKDVFDYLGLDYLKPHRR